MKKEVNLSREEQVKLEEEVQEYLKENGNDCYYGEYEIWFEEKTCNVNISWGDWKHDHLWMKHFVGQFLESKGFDYSIDSTVTEEDGSDCYSANHTFKLLYK